MTQVSYARFVRLTTEIEQHHHRHHSLRHHTHNPFILKLVSLDENKKQKGVSLQYSSCIFTRDFLTTSTSNEKRGGCSWETHIPTHFSRKGFFGIELLSWTCIPKLREFRVWRNCNCNWLHQHFRSRSRVHFPSRLQFVCFNYKNYRHYRPKTTHKSGNWFLLVKQLFAWPLTSSLDSNDQRSFKDAEKTRKVRENHW